VENYVGERNVRNAQRKINLGVGYPVRIESTNAENS
jgi:hypothetical protein